MSYQLADMTDGVFGEVFETEAEARAALDKIVGDETEGEANWLMELAGAVSEGGAANSDDEDYVRRILAEAEDKRRAVAVECARERLYALNKIARI